MLRMSWWDTAKNQALLVSTSAVLTASSFFGNKVAAQTGNLDPQKPKIEISNEKPAQETAPVPEYNRGTIDAKVLMYAFKGREQIAIYTDKDDFAGMIRIKGNEAHLSDLAEKIVGINGKVDVFGYRGDVAVDHILMPEGTTVEQIETALVDNKAFRNMAELKAEVKAQEQADQFLQQQEAEKKAVLQAKESKYSQDIQAMVAQGKNVEIRVGTPEHNIHVAGFSPGLVEVDDKSAFTDSTAQAQLTSYLKEEVLGDVGLDNVSIQGNVMYLKGREGYAAAHQIADFENKIITQNGVKYDVSQSTGVGPDYGVSAPVESVAELPPKGIPQVTSNGPVR